MYKKYQITGTIRVVSGLHIGGSTQYSPIGSVDAPVIRDAVSNEPIIPGSSLKGKMRTLLAKNQVKDAILKEPNQDPPEITRLFGASKANKNKKTDKTELQKITPARLQFKDMFVTNRDELIENCFLDSLTEVKFENSISRLYGTATPRQIERVVPGVEFGLNIIYDSYFVDQKSVKKDFELINKGFQLLQYDYLGGNGTRGHGQVEFVNLKVKCVFEDKGEEADFLKELEQILNKNIKQEKTLGDAE